MSALTWFTHVYQLNGTFAVVVTACLFLFFTDIQIPYGVVFGGTDINEDVKVEQKRVVMEQVLLKAR